MLIKTDRPLIGRIVQHSLIVLVVILVSAAPSSGLEGSAIVLRVMDGETLKIEYRNQKELIKLIGIDTPKSKLHRNEEKDALQSRQDFLPMTSMGIEATRYLKSLVKNRETVVVEFDVEKRNREGVLQGYVFLSDGRMVNEEILKAGYAYLATSAPNLKYRQRLLQGRTEAWKNGRGIWKKRKGTARSPR